MDCQSCPISVFFNLYPLNGTGRKKQQVLKKLLFTNWFWSKDRAEILKKNLNILNPGGQRERPRPGLY